MKLQSIKLVTVLFSTFLVLPGCIANLTPMEVSERFWTAVKNKDTKEVKKYIASGTVNNSESDNLLPLEEVRLGRTVIDGDRAWVDTTVIISGRDSFELPLETVLLKKEDQWKVNYDATVESLSNDNAVARAIGNISDLSAQFADDLDKSLEEIQKAIPEVKKEIKKIEENVKHHLPEIQQRMDDLLRQLEDALEDLNRDTEQQGTTEI